MTRVGQARKLFIADTLIIYRSNSGWDILCFVKKQKWIGFFEVHEPIYPRLVRAFFEAIVVDRNNFTLKATLKALISEKLLADLLGIPANSLRLYEY